MCDLGFKGNNNESCASWLFFAYFYNSMRSNTYPIKGHWLQSAWLAIEYPSVSNIFCTSQEMYTYALCKMQIKADLSMKIRVGAVRDTNEITKKMEIIGLEHHTLPNIKSNMNGSSPLYPLHHSGWLGNASHVSLNTILI